MRTAAVPKDKWEQIKRSYRFVPDDEVKDLPLEIRTDPHWTKCHCEGCDDKFGTRMVLSGSRIWRWPDIGEFYGDDPGPWD